LTEKLGLVTIRLATPQAPRHPPCQSSLRPRSRETRILPRVSDIADGVEFHVLITHASAVLLTRGLEVLDITLRSMALEMITQVSNSTGVSTEEAIHLVSPEVLADLVVRSVDESAEGVDGFGAVRKVRMDVRPISVPAGALGRMIMAAAQAGKFAATNGDSNTAGAAMDLVTEIGPAIWALDADGTARLPGHLLDEVADLVDRAAARIEQGAWSICPCGEQHGQANVDRKAAETMRHDVTVIRDLIDAAGPHT
jgi:hypothetical protein